MTVTVDTYTIRIQRDSGVVRPMFMPDLSAALIEAEENLTDLLPDGYRAVIRRWDEGDEDESPNV